MNVVEKNKLIANFMEAKYAGDLTFDIPADSLWLPVHGVCNYHTTDLGKGKILKYHKSWDWLMPVIHKIEFQMDKGPMRIEYQHYSDGWWAAFRDDPSDDTFYWTTQTTKNNSRLEACYNAIVNFIIWHNDNCKKE